MRLFFFVLLFVLTSFVKGQVYTIDQSIPVFVDGEQLPNPWVGGLNSGQYSTMDVNGDGVEDLVIFDRTARKVNVFVNENNTYRYTPKFIAGFPPDLNDWMLLRDINCDGKKDIFTSDPLGIRVYVNESSDEGLKWRIFNSRSPQPSPILTKGFSASPINIQMNSSDIPSIEDLDGDGDLDILLFRFSSSSTVEFHKNLNVERNGNCDSLQFERVTQTWGSFEECGCGVFAFNGEDCPISSGGKDEHQSGKSILAIDMDGDGDMEAIVGEEECVNLQILDNVGDKQLAIMSNVSTNFPNSTFPVSLYTFPAAYYEDVDFDGVKDIIVAPNAASDVNFGVNFAASSWVYKNTGSNDNPSFSFIQNDFLQDGMIDWGENAAPAFFDYDNDGDQDLFVSNMISHSGSYQATIKLYKNVGSPALPSFELANRDYMGFSQLNGINMKPQFQDINNDGLTDLVLSYTQVLNGATYLYYMLNKGTAFSDELNLLYTGMGIYENAKVYDINNDGLVDLLIGRSTGRLEYLKNRGSINAPDFILEDQSFYGLDSSPFRQNTSVDIADLDADGFLDLVTGDARGNITLYRDFLNNVDIPLEGETEIINISDVTMTLNLGARIMPVMVNLFNENKPSIVLGTGQGGLNVLRNDSAKESPFSGKVGVYPNPVKVDQLLTIKSIRSAKGRIVSTAGQILIQNLTLVANEESFINVSMLKEGLYILIMEGASKSEAIRFVVHR
jgi:hypothetical protein